MQRRRLFTAATDGLALSVLGLALAVATEACSSDSDSGTSGKRVVLHTRVTVSPSAKRKFTATSGWDVTLSAAAVSAGPFYYFDGVPPLVLHSEQKTWHYAANFLGLGTAHAHPGHYQAGNAMGEMLESSSADLLGGAVDFPDGNGISGVYRSARFTFAEASGPARKVLAGHVALAAGVAEKVGEAPRYFRAVADLSDVEKHATRGEVAGCELKEADVQADGTITVTVDPKIWFELVDFSDAQEGSAGAEADLPSDSLAKVGFVLGVAQLSAYEFSYEAP